MWMLGWSLGIFPTSLYDFFAEESAAPARQQRWRLRQPEFEELASQHC
jgi:hypothetical protein